ncbi:dipeptidase PepV [Peribacillus sp. SCS-155]|uniref:dipeptidase PepV n=1 Tax=Peribacillus sedimenti TaxID=3115297 RepID=UPI00390690F1
MIGVIIVAQIHWRQEIEQRKESLLQDTQELLRIRSVLDEEQATEEAPLGKGVKAALDYMLSLGAKDGFVTKNVDNLAGHLEMGEGDELIGILCHVDVVPEGDGWSSDPFSADIRDGKIYARGAIDDKGPTMAAYYGMKIIKELGLPLGKRVRMIIGTDEESDWRCVDRYFEKEEMPAMGFAPDADFPIINAEKGIWDFTVQQNTVTTASNTGITVKEFSSGRRPNMVPDYAIVSIKAASDSSEIADRFNTFIQKHSLAGTATLKEGGIIIELEGVSAHGMEPNNGVNAGLFLSAFLSGLNLDDQAKEYFTFVHDKLFGDSRGHKLGLAFSDQITGELTINAGVLRYTQDGGGSIGFTTRYPVTYNWKESKEKLVVQLAQHNFGISAESNSKPHHVTSDSFLIKTLQQVYKEQTGQEAKLLSIGGGTYARSLEQGVAFGPLFPGSEDVAHQKDEYIAIDDMLSAAAIYAHAIYELAK